MACADGLGESGSNNWAVAPARAAGGHALIANDPHLLLMNPASFHLAHLTTPTRDVAGVAFPGSPAIAIGHNGKIGWGATAVVYDVTDLYVEATSAGQVAGATAVPERIQVKLGKPVGFTIQLVPAHGPVIPASIGAARGVSTALSMKWTGQVPTWEMQAFLDLGKDRSVDEAFAALKSFQVGAQNFVIADVAGKIGYDPHARVPIRPPPPRGRLRLGPGRLAAGCRLVRAGRRLVRAGRRLVRAGRRLVRAGRRAKLALRGGAGRR